MASGLIMAVATVLVSFSSMHAAANMQNHWVGISYTWGMCIFGLLILGLGLALVGYLTYTAKRKAQLLQNGSFNDNFIEKTDDLENDVAAMSLSVAFTMFVRFVLSGHHPVGSQAEFGHTAQQRLSLLIYGIVCLLVAVFSVKFCSKKAAESDSYAVKRMMRFFHTVAAMNVAWAFLYWGEWEFFEYLYPGEAINGRVMFAIIATIACGLLLIGLSKYPSTESGASITGKIDKMVALMALALVTLGLQGCERPSFRIEIERFDEAIAAHEALIDGHKKEEQRLRQELFRLQATCDEKDLALHAGKDRERLLQTTQTTLEEVVCGYVVVGFILWALSLYPWAEYQQVMWPDLD